jgi:hypothetical protein
MAPFLTLPHGFNDEDTGMSCTFSHLFFAQLFPLCNTLLRLLSRVLPASGEIRHARLSPLLSTLDSSNASFFSLPPLF